MVFEINKYKLKITITKLAYFVIVVSYALYLATDMQYNTAFVDEAIYATVGEEIMRKVYWESAISWMGGSYLYPYISGFINRYYGLEGIRIFSMFCVIVVGIIAGKIAKQFRGKYTEVLTLFLFLFSAVSLNLGQLGTYDAPSLVFTSVSVYTAILSRYKNGVEKLLFTFASSIMITMAIFSKYIALFFLPVILLLITLQGKTFKEIVKNIFARIPLVMFWSIPILTSVGIYFFKYSTELISFFSGSNFSEPATTRKIVSEIFSSVNVVMIVTIISLIYTVIKVKGEKKLLALILTLAGLIPLIYHLGALNIRSLPKHMVFSLFFWTPTAAWIINKSIVKVKTYHSKDTLLYNMSNFTFTIVMVLLVTNLWYNFSKHWRFQRSWPSVTKTLEYLRENRKNTDKIFAEASAVYKFHLFDGFEDPATWPSTWYLEYEGNSGTEGMKAAIKNQEFDYIILNNYFTSYINKEIEPTIIDYYEIVQTDSYKLSGQYDQITTIWKPKNDLIDKTDFANNSLVN